MPWLCCKLAAVALIRPLVWELLYATHAALKKKGKEPQKTEEIKPKKPSKMEKYWMSISRPAEMFPHSTQLHLWHMEVPRLGVKTSLCHSHSNVGSEPSL